MKELNNNNVTEVTFLGAWLAVIFSSSSGPLGEPVRRLFLWPSWLQRTFAAKLFGLWPFGLGKKKKKRLSSASSRQWETLLNIPFHLWWVLLVWYCAGCRRVISGCCPSESNTATKKIYFPITLFCHDHFSPPSPLKQMSSLLIEWKDTFISAVNGPEQQNTALTNGKERVVFNRSLNWEQYLCKKKTFDSLDYNKHLVTTCPKKRLHLCKLKKMKNNEINTILTALNNTWSKSKEKEIYYILKRPCLWQPTATHDSKAAAAHNALKKTEL